MAQAIIKKRGNVNMKKAATGFLIDFINILHAAVCEHGDNLNDLSLFTPSGKIDIPIEHERVQLESDDFGDVFTEFFEGYEWMTQHDLISSICHPANATTFGELCGSLLYLGDYYSTSCGSIYKASAFSLLFQIAALVDSTHDSWIGAADRAKDCPTPMARSSSTRKIKEERCFKLVHIIVGL